MLKINDKALKKHPPLGLKHYMGKRTGHMDQASKMRTVPEEEVCVPHDPASAVIWAHSSGTSFKKKYIKNRPVLHV